MTQDPSANNHGQGKSGEKCAATPTHPYDRDNAVKFAEERADALLASGLEFACLQMLSLRERRQRRAEITETNASLHLPNEMSDRAYRLQKALERRFENEELWRRLDPGNTDDAGGSKGLKIEKFIIEKTTTSSQRRCPEDGESLVPQNAPVRRADNIFRQIEGGDWCFRFNGGDTLRHVDRVPFHYVRELLKTPGKSHVPVDLRDSVDLRLPTESSDMLEKEIAGEPLAVGVSARSARDNMISDEDHKKLIANISALRKVITEREMRLQEVKGSDDPQRLARADEAETELVRMKDKCEELETKRRAVSFRGRPRQYVRGNRAEKSRSLVCKHISKTIEILRERKFLEFAKHLETNILNKGREPIYVGKVLFATEPDACE